MCGIERESELPHDIVKRGLRDPRKAFEPGRNEEGAAGEAFNAAEEEKTGGRENGKGAEIFNHGLCGFHCSRKGRGMIGVVLVYGAVKFQRALSLVGSNFASVGVLRPTAVSASISRELGTALGMMR